LFQTIKYELEFPLDQSNNPSLIHREIPESDETSNLTNRLLQDLSGPMVASLADEATDSDRCSAQLKNINDALNNWRSTWDLRLFRELWCENDSFFNDPLPFWWLAKLYVLLHLSRNSIGLDSEFAISRAEFGSGETVFATQAKIVKWFSRFRNQTHLLEVLEKEINSKA
jgi:hypothetical protein